MSGKLDEEKTKFEGGATRSKQPYRCDLIPGCVNRRAGLRWGLGAEKHGDNNWKNGGAEFIKQCVSHLELHLSLFKDEQNKNDDNLGAILWGAGALAWFEENKPEEFKKAFEFIPESGK